MHLHFYSHFLCFLSVLCFIGLSSCATLEHTSPKQQQIQLNLKTVHTLDVYSDNQTLHALFSGLDSDSNQLAVKYIHSLNAGKNWISPVTVNLDLAPVKKSKRGNDFQLAASGNKIMAIWQTQGGEPWTGILAVALSRDFGQTWQQINSPVNDQFSKVDQGYFDIAADHNGEFHLVWLDDREEAGNTQGLRYAHFNDQQNTWDQHATIENTACTCCWPSISISNNNHVHVLFRDDSPRDMHLISSLDNGKSWQTSKTSGAFEWDFIGCPHQGGGLTTSLKNEKTILHSVIWNGKTNNPGIYYSQSELNQDKIMVLQRLGNNSSSSGDIASLDNNHLRIVYTTGDFETKSVVSRVSNDAGLTWSNEIRLSRVGSEPSHPRIVATDAGYRFFWTEWQKNGDALAIITALE